MIRPPLSSSLRALAFILPFSSMLVAAPGDISRDSTGVTLETDTGLTRVEIWSERIVRVRHTPGPTLPGNTSLSVNTTPRTVDWQYLNNGDSLRLSTPELTVNLDTSNGQVTFVSPSSTAILSESAGSSSFQPTTIGNAKEASHIVGQSFALADGEAIYGLGQHQQGIMNQVGHRVTLQQENREVGIPVMLSSRGYALLWDNPAITTVDVGQTTAGKLTWSSEAGDAIDYYFCYGPDPDDAIAGYRQLTGNAPMFARWAWGFWQCKERYQSQAELLSVVNGYRDRGIPLDGIIQDWRYWPDLNDATAAEGKSGWGSHYFDPTRYPDPAGLMQTLHEKDVHMIISVWAKFDVTNSGVSIPNLQALEAVNGAFPQIIPYVYPAGQGKWLDPFGTPAREVYWSQLSDKLFSQGLDGWWLDASEAEFSGNWGEFRNFDTAIGSGAKVYNAYPLMETTAVHDGQRAETDQKRVFILTRSAYAGQQRNGAVTWSGDISASWDVFSKQIPAGLNFTASGLPYWNTDIGGFFSGDPATASYAELFTRWFQYGAFCPMFRVHGTNYSKEVWRFPSNVQPILTNYIKLRYHLIPYIYSTSWKVTDQGYTMMRPLMMDFRDDTNVYNIGDQFMFGPSLMVSPVTTSGATSRDVYLPAGTKWYDFWTGLSLTGGETISASAPLETLPLYVRGGSILPYAPVADTAKNNPDTIELRVYTGADATYSLYEDEGDNYDYEAGTHAAIPVTWDEAAGTLTIGARTGDFPGMLTSRTFKVVFVSPLHGAGLDLDSTPDAVVNYDGQSVTISRPSLPDLPQAPTSLTATPKNGAIQLTWNASTTGTVFSVQRALTSSGPYSTLNPTVIGLSYTDTDVEAGISYHYVVSAINAAGAGPLSNEIETTNGQAALRALFMFNESTGTSVGDASSNGWHSTLVNGPTFVPGLGGNAIKLDGTDDQVAVPAGAIAGLNNFTVSAWVKLAAQTDGARIFDFGDGTRSLLYLTSRDSDSMAVHCGLSTGTSGENGIDGTTALPVGQWTHVAITVSGQTGILYVDGQEAGRNESLSFTPLTTSDLTNNLIGGGQAGPGSHLNGQIDDFRIYSGALAADAIQTLFNTGANAVPSSWTDADIGSPALTGSSGSDGSTWHVTAGGSDIWDASDQMHYVYLTRSGDTEFIARVNSVEAANAWTKAGIMVRASSAANAVNCLIAITPSNGVTFQYRSTAGGASTYNATSGLTAPYWLKITRLGNTFTSYRSADGVSWTQHGSATLTNMPASALYGLAVTAHSTTALAGTTFDHIQFLAPPPPSPLTGSTSAPSIGNDDVYYLPGETNDADNIDGTGLKSEDNDESTYVAPDRSSKGQVFTTGHNPGGYILRSFTIQHVLWTQFLSNGTWYDIQPGDTFQYQIGTMFDTTKTPIYSGIAQYSGTAVKGAGTSGSGTYLTFDLTNVDLPALKADTTYYFEIAPGSGGPYFELNGTKLEDYSSGWAFRGNAGADDGSIASGINRLTGNYAFHVGLERIAASDFASWIASYPTLTSGTGLQDDPDHDGIPNGVENIFGTSPVEANPGISELGFVDNTFVFQHPQNPSPASDLSFKYLWSMDLKTFYSAGEPQNGTTVTFAPSINDPVAGTTTVFAQISGATPRRLFVKIEVFNPR